MSESSPLRPIIAGVEIPLACDLHAIPSDERQEHFELTERLFGEYVQERIAEKESVVFRFDSEAYPMVTAFVGRERLCCSFMTFEIKVQPGEGALWLRMSGDAETVDTLLRLGESSRE